MPETAPVVRVDRQKLLQDELAIARQVVIDMAEAINAVLKTGPLPENVILPPDQAQRKAALMQQPPQGGA